ncbi:MAG: class I SAM-dependent methyltransferase [Candidatus Woesearchaeota archaeon]
MTDTQRLSQFFDQYAEVENKYFLKPALRNLIGMAVLKMYLPEEGKVLDAGCGTGRDAYFFSTPRLHFSCLDISGRMIETARKNCSQKNCDFRVADIREIPFEANSFDCSISLGDGVSFCLNDYEKAISELCRVTKNGGTIIIGVDNLYGKLVNSVSNGNFAEARRILKKREAIELSEEFPVRCFDIEEFKIIAMNNGLEVLKVVPVISSLYNYRSSKLNENFKKDIINLEQEIIRCNLFSWGGDHTIYVLRKLFT